MILPYSLNRRCIFIEHKIEIFNRIAEDRIHVLRYVDTLIGRKKITMPDNPLSLFVNE